jgi:hypothetical protein
MTRIAPVLVVCALFIPAAAAEPEVAPPPRVKKPVPAGVDPKLTSDDAEYGFTKDKPIKVGTPGMAGSPAAEHEYLRQLRDDDGMAVRYRRVGNVGMNKDKHIIDLYLVTTSAQKEFRLYLDMYNPDNDPAKQPAPKGLFKAKRVD